MVDGTEQGAPAGIDVKLSLPPTASAGAFGRRSCIARLPGVVVSAGAAAAVQGADCSGCQRCMRSLRLKWGDTVTVAARARPCRPLTKPRCAASDYSAPITVTV
jgi:hypothetical protein